MHLWLNVFLRLSGRLMAGIADPGYSPSWQQKRAVPAPPLQYVMFIYL
jgi:hypothetical protein